MLFCASASVWVRGPFGTHIWSIWNAMNLVIFEGVPLRFPWFLWFSWFLWFLAFLSCLGFLRFPKVSKLAMVSMVSKVSMVSGCAIGVSCRIVPEHCPLGASYRIATVRVDCKGVWQECPTGVFDKAARECSAGVSRRSVCLTRRFPKVFYKRRAPQR